MGREGGGGGGRGAGGARAAYACDSASTRERERINVTPRAPTASVDTRESAPPIPSPLSPPRQPHSHHHYSSILPTPDPKTPLPPEPYNISIPTHTSPNPPNLNRTASRTADCPPPCRQHGPRGPHNLLDPIPLIVTQRISSHRSAPPKATTTSHTLRLGIAEPKHQTFRLRSSVPNEEA